MPHCSSSRASATSEEGAREAPASGAFGRGIAITLGALGANVVLASGSEDELKVVADEVREVGGKAEIIVRRPDSLEDAEAMRDLARAALTCMSSRSTR